MLVTLPSCVVQTSIYRLFVVQLRYDTDIKKNITYALIVTETKLQSFLPLQALKLRKISSILFRNSSNLKNLQFNDAKFCNLVENVILITEYYSNELF